MKDEGLKAIQPRTFIPRTTDSKHGKRVYKNLLLDREKPTMPNQVWAAAAAVSEITFIPLIDGKWAYLSACQGYGVTGAMSYGMDWCGHTCWPV